MKTLVYTPWKWLVAIPGIALSTLVFGSLCLLLLTVLPPRRVNRFIPVWWARVNNLLIPVAVTVHGREHIEPGQSYVIAANHLSHIDILALYAELGVDMRFVMKQELRKVPVIGVACAGLGHIYVDRANRQAAVKALTDARGRLAADGASVIFFPEGTRSNDGLLHGFKKGAFVTARDMNLGILPVTLRGTDAVLPARTLGLLPGRTEIVIHRPISAARVQSTSMDELAAETRQIIASALPPDRVAADGG